MASKIESSEELNTSKCGPSSVLSRPLPIYTALQQPIASSSCTRRENQILAPLQDDRGRKPREIESSRAKGALYFSVPVEQPPTIVTDQEYIARKKTFDTFLKSRDIEFMMGGKGSGQNPRTLERHSSLDQVKNSQSKSQKELKSTLKNKGGKMFTNELWSDGYYVSVINSSNLKKKSEQKSHLMLKPSQQKAQELESLCNTVQTSKQKTSSYFFEKNPSFDVTQTMREAFQPLEFSSLYQTPDASPSALPKGKSALRSILKNIIPRKGSADKLIGSQSTEINPKDLTPDFSPNFMLSDAARSFHLPKPYKRPQNLHISFDKKYEEEAMSMTSETLSPVVPPKSKRTLHAGGFLASISSKFSTTKNHCVLSNSSKNSRRERSDEADTFEASDTMRHDSGHNLQLKNSQSSPENIEARQKMQQLINQCIDLGQKNKDLEKEVMSTKADFEAFTTRRQRMRLQLQKTMELSERLNRQTKFIKVLYNQKQGSS